MDNSKYPRTYFQKRYAQDLGFRSRCLASARKSRLKRRHGITVEQFDAQFAEQHGACACCHAKLGRAFRIDHPLPGFIRLLCVGCFGRVEILRHICKYAKRFEAWFKQRGMTVQLERLYATLRMCGQMPGPIETEGRPS